MQEIVELASGRPKVLEFFAGIGLARMGLEASGFRVAWANDYEKDKMALYKGHFGSSSGEPDFTLGDIAGVSVDDLPKGAALAWGSSPCTDLSLAGARGGIRAGESNAFWHYIRLLKDLGEDRPEVAVLENVVGLATSNGGDDLAAAVRAFNELGYSVDVLTLDARRFIPQSRPRLFLVAAMYPPVDGGELASDLRPAWLQGVHNDPTLRTHRAPLPNPPQLLLEGFGDLVEAMADIDERWWDEDRTAAFEKSLSPVQAVRIGDMKRSEKIVYRTAYRRTRRGVPVWEVRPDDISGCLRTARGGSSKQAVVKLGQNNLQVRWMTPLEYARLMGASDYNLQNARTNQALFAFGDAVAVPAVDWLARNYLLPLVRHEFHSTSLKERAVG
ncbi:DNA cytosine methyltransferase [Curtobacterium flaccumfaciens]|uniref:DNA cytosine methyltransferase n=1 Tax=Curtobacterium flaccumfaciens TaxID=2035 RepID=UPI0027E13152|nr:DNA cytosine methyltransferase [Curtobacterium flaccumfaciens]